MSQNPRWHTNYDNIVWYVIDYYSSCSDDAVPSNLNVLQDRSPETNVGSFSYVNTPTQCCSRTDMNVVIQHAVMFYNRTSVDNDILT